MENHLHFLAGWGAGVFGVLVGHPLDIIKTHQQMSNRELSTRDAIRRVIRKDGFPGFYKGLSLPLLNSGSLNALYFGVYNCSLSFLQSSRGHREPLPSNSGWLQDLFVAGYLGGMAQASLACPTELMRTRMQLGKGVVAYKTTARHTAARINAYLTLLDFYRKYGIRGFYVGIVPTVWRDAIGGGVYISSYQFTRHNMYGKLNLNPGLLETLVAGGVAGLASWIPVVPFDTIKSRIQGDNFENPMYKGMIECSVDLYKHSSYHGFFKGFFMIIVRSVPVNVAIIYGYELLLFILQESQRM